MRTIFALVLGLALAAPAQAIVIDSGFLSGGVVTDFSLFFDMDGEGFSVTGIDVVGGNLLPFEVTRPQPESAPVNISSTVQIASRLSSQLVVASNGYNSRGDLVSNGEVFDAGILSGSLTFDVEPFLLTMTPELGPMARGESRFTMTGSVSFNGQTIALEGGGTVEYSGSSFGNAISPVSVRFDFSPVAGSAN